MQKQGKIWLGLALIGLVTSHANEENMDFEQLHHIRNIHDADSLHHQWVQTHSKGFLERTWEKLSNREDPDAFEEDNYLAWRRGAVDRADPQGNIDWNSAIQSPAPTLAQPSPGPTPNWVNIGPFGYDSTQNTGYNPGIGRLSCVAEDPTTSNTLYVGSPDGALWKTTNGGSTWAP